MNCQILDCTLRDGGYYNSWDYRENTVRRYLDAVEAAGIGLVEIGFRTRAVPGFMGKFRFSRDSLIDRLFEGRRLRAAVMSDAKEFLTPEGALDRDVVNEVYQPRSKSRVELVRVAATFKNLAPALEMVDQLHGLGYQTSLNLMQASLLDDKQTASAASAVDDSSADMLYLADSFGSLSPRETASLFKVLRSQFSRTLGFHSHDNMGLALPNSLAAVDAGVELVDTALLGMGRGAGNLRTEQFLFYLRYKEGRSDLDPMPLFDVALNDFEELRARYNWGPNLAYLLSAAHNVHPTYPQHFLQNGKHDLLEVMALLDQVHNSGKGTSFSPERVTQAWRNRIMGTGAAVQVASLPNLARGMPKPDVAGGTRPVLILGSGPSIHDRADDINEFIQLRQPIVLECNFHEAITEGRDHLSFFINYLRLRESAAGLARRRKRVVLGMSEITQSTAEVLRPLQVHHLPYEVSKGRFDPDAVPAVLPFEIVSMLAFAFSLNLGTKAIYACGFDGYHRENDPADAGENQLAIHRNMESFLGLLAADRRVKTGDTKVLSITPTTYPMEQSSIYALM